MLLKHFLINISRCINIFENSFNKILTRKLCNFFWDMDKERNLQLLSPLHIRRHSFQFSEFLKSPLFSPVSSVDISPDSPSGLLQNAKKLLKEVFEKRHSTSSISIDEDMTKINFYYKHMVQTEKCEFLRHASVLLATDHENVVKNIEERPKKLDDDDLMLSAIVRWEERLRQSLEPLYFWFASQISHLEGGVKFIIDLRGDILDLVQSGRESTQMLLHLKTFESALCYLLSLWFTVGLLHLQRVTWKSSCEMLQKVSEYEAVHPFRNWIDLKRRVGNYRRCFVFTHSCMPSEPIVVLHTFLTNEISNSMDVIVERPKYLSFDESTGPAVEDPSVITTAIFYSITSTQKGLKGIELGNYLIKKVVKQLQAEFPYMSQFSSLSPIHGFKSWLNIIIQDAKRGKRNCFTVQEIELLSNHFGFSLMTCVYEKLLKLLSTNGWVEDESLLNILEAPLMRLCAYYLFQEKRRLFALNSVANFHLKNGAVIWRLNWLADKTPRGLGGSCGIMVNYRYFLENCENNSKTYLEIKHIEASESIQVMAKKAAEILLSPVSSNKYSKI